jgi:hypothetical protein
MKKLFIATVLFINLYCAFAQTKTVTAEHLTFKGVPLDGTLEEYVLKMKQNGFKHLSTSNGTAALQGDFAGYKDCYVGVSTLSKKNLVHKIGVLFPEKETWSALSDNYFNLKEMLTEKYGEPSDDIEIFGNDSSYQPTDDFIKMHKVKFDECKYRSIWETEKGKIQLSIGHGTAANCFVSLAYFDKINGATIKKQAIDDL